MNLRSIIDGADGFVRFAATHDERGNTPAALEGLDDLLRLLLRELPRLHAARGAPPEAPEGSAAGG